jgi:Nucleotidyl transferase AbiEii toxin, Type IV TA system
MLRPDTQALWEVLEKQVALRGFVLAGGTALSMHLHHRLSEDLDFMFIGAKLPRSQINALKKACIPLGFEFVANDSVVDLQSWEDCGDDLADYQQNFVVGGVKVTFWAPDPDVLRIMGPGKSDAVRVASVEEIFATKCLVCADRSKTRDWFDLYTLLKGEHGFEPIDVFDTFKNAGVPNKFDIALSRMTRGEPGIVDEGFSSLLSNAPSIEEMKSYFKGVFGKAQVQVAQRSMDEKNKLNLGSPSDA